MVFDRDGLQAAVRRAAREGIFLGTSSWKYPGWCGQLYEEQRYIYRGRFSTTRFERECLREYAEVFPTVCVDAGYYRFPDGEGVKRLASQVPSDFLFSFKVTDEITIKRFPRLPRFGNRAGQPNENFLDAGLFTAAFLGPLEAIRKQTGMLMFEFSAFHPGDFSRGREFVDALDRFFAALPRGWRYGVEIRNQSFLHPDYFAMLSSHGVTHVYNNWTAMPSVEEQLDLPGSRTSAVAAARFLLKPGRAYAEAVAAFSPYNEVKAPLPAAWRAAARLMREGALVARGETFLYVNNRLEGNALSTIRSMLEAAGKWEEPPPQTLTET